jgi:HPt (histidine-containing phosphotransfer) domain-containing protein
VEGSETIRSDFVDVWREARPTIEGRVAAIEGAIDALEAGSLDEEQAKAAIEAAHKLAGVLGTFGLGRGSELASELESGLQTPRSASAALGALATELAELVSTGEIEPRPTRPDPP